MRRAFIFIFIGSSLFALAKDAPSPLLSQLQAELLNKQFPIKRLIGGATQETVIDTEFYSDGSVRYLARRLLLSAGKSLYVPPEALTLSYPPGNNARVQKIELKDDRIEFLLAAGPSQTYAKIKLMFGKTEVRNATFFDAMRRLGLVLSIPRAEQLINLTSEFDQLTEQLSAAKQRVAGAVDAVAKEAALLDEKSSLNLLARNRASYWSAAQMAGSPPNYQSELQSVEANLQTVHPQALGIERQRIRDSLDANRRDSAGLRQDLQRGAPATQAEWDRRSTQLAQFKSLIDARTALIPKLESLGDSPGPDVRSEIAGDQKAADSIGRALEGQRQQLQVNEINRTFAAMEKQRAQLEKAYLDSFGTAKERPSLQALLAHLQIMRDNRAAAEQLNVPGVAAQVAEIDKRLTAYRNRLR